jgi:hypothetical protein
MLSNISWQGYWTTLAITTVLYYILVFVFFYRSAFVQYFQRQIVNHKFHPELGTEIPLQMGLSGKQSVTVANKADKPEYVPAVHSLVDEVHAFFESTDPRSHSKTSLLATLKSIVQKHAGVKGTPYQYSLNNLILFLAEQNGELHLSAEEVGSIWL